MSTGSLASKLTTIRKSITKSSKVNRGSPSVPDAHSLYLAALQACNIPVLGIGGATKAPNPNLDMKDFKATNFSIVKDNTIYLCLSTMQSFKAMLHDRIQIMESIQTIEAKSFSKSGKRVDELVLALIHPMTDIKALIDQIAFVCRSQIKDISNQLKSISPEDTLTETQMDEYLMKTVELFLATIKATVEMAESSSYEVRKHNLFQIQNLKPVISKYFLTSTQMLQDADGNLSLGLRDLFDVSHTDHSNNLRTFKVTHTVGSVFKNLTNSLENLSRGQLAGYQKEDFETAEAYSAFIEREVKQLTSLISVFGMNNPTAPGSAGSSNLPKHFPSDQKVAEKFYKILVALCIDRDLHESNGASILSKLSKEILNECAISWNIFKDFKEAAIFDAAVKKYSSGQIGLVEVFPQFNIIRKISAHYHLLRKTDKDLILSGYLKLRVSLNAQLQQSLELVNLQNLTPDDCSDMMSTVAFMIAEIHEDKLCNLSPSLRPLSKDQVERDVAEEIKVSAKVRLDYMMFKLEQAFAGPANLLLRTSKQIQMFISDLRKYKVYYPKEILTTKFVYEVAGEEYILTANTLVEVISGVDSETPMLQILELYDLFRELYDLCVELKVPKDSMVQIESFFLPIIDTWLTRTDSKWSEWIVRAYAVDTFEPISSPKRLNSTSVLDVFSAFQSALSFVTKFRFNDSEKRELLKRSFIMAMHRSLDTYCKLIFESFEAMEKPNDDTVITPQHIIKFNNLMFAQELMEKLLDQLEVQEAESQTVHKVGKAKDAATNNNNTAYKIKIIGARHLSYQNFQCPDAYCVMTLGGQVVGATNIVPNNCHPFWFCDYTVNLPDRLNTNTKAFLQFNVYHDNNLGNEISCGRAAVFLRDESLQNYLTHNATLSMRPQGSLSIRIRRDGEVDDTRWYVQRTQELLRFTLEDIIHAFSSKITRVLEKAVNSIVQNTQGRKVFGVVLTQEVAVTDSVVEGYLADVFVFIDSTLALFNKLVDRRFEDMVEMICPQISSAADKTASNNALTSHSDLITQTTIASLGKGLKARSGNLLASGGGVVEAVVDYRKPPAILRLFWHEILLYCTSILDSFVEETITEANLRQAKIVDSMIEFCKAIFHCKLGGKGKPVGLQLNQLETALYRQLRESLDAVLVA